MHKSSYVLSDDVSREYLYGVFSARGASIAIIVLATLAFILGLVKYPEIVLCGVHIEIFNYAVTGALISAVAHVLLSISGLLHQGYIPSANVADNIHNLDGCKDANGNVIPNVFDRANKIRAAVVFGLLTVPSIMYMARELRAYMMRFSKDNKDFKRLNRNT